MQKKLIDIKNNRVTSFWSDGSITWLPLKTYEFNAYEDYSVLVQSGTAGYNKSRIVNGSYLKALLNKIINNKN